MKLKNILCLGLLLGFLGLSGCSKDEFAKINSDPSKITEFDILFAYTEALSMAENNDYGVWFRNYVPCYMTWNQSIVPDRWGGNAPDMNKVVTSAGQGWLIPTLKKQIESIKQAINTEGEDGLTYTYMKASLDPILIYMAIFGIDTGGSTAYSEAGLGLIDPSILTPKYETQEELLNLWLKQLDASIEVFSKPVKNSKGENVSQLSLGAQDIIYHGDYAKWGKYANSLKLKIAVRLINANKAKAIAIAKEVVDSPVGYMESQADDYIYHLGSDSYHMHGNTVPMGPGSKQLISFMVNNKDPRVLVLYEKNDFNSVIVNGFLENDRPLPSYIMDVVNTTIDAQGVKHFAGWKAPGEPWVRFHGAPIDINASTTPEMNEAYFNRNNFELSMNGVSKQYVPTALYNEELIRSRKNRTFPSLPGIVPVEIQDPRPWYGAMLTSAEVNLYLAELKLLGADIPKTAEAYFNIGVENSVILMDFLARKNDIAYYKENAGFDDEDVVTALQPEMLANLKQRPNYKLTGSEEEQFEKLYMQMYIHSLQNPNEQYILARRTGFPYYDSTIYPRLPFSQKNPNDPYPIPRRFQFGTPSESDLMYNIKIAAYKEQGFTLDKNDPEILAKERLWYDKNSPEFGKRPNY